MIRFAPMAGTPVPDLPRRDLAAIYPYLNRREFEAKSARDQLEHVEGILQQLAAASRMQ